jgi:hypothetical protein
LISYSVNEQSSWVDPVTWNPSVTGHYFVKAYWTGNQQIPSAETIVDMTIASYIGGDNSQSQKVFSVTSNSTITQFAFNSQTKELTFNVKGPSDTKGYVELFIPKTLVPDNTGFAVHIDDKTIAYTSEDKGDSWRLYFTYSHSTHDVSISLATPNDNLPYTLPL